MENLSLAFYKAARGKRRKRDVAQYQRSLDRNLGLLRAQLISRDVPVGEYRYFTVYEPKERLICAASFRERVLHHAIINVLDPILDRFQIHDSYACRAGKGTEAAVVRAFSFSRRFGHFLKLDVRRYFDSIPHGRLLGLLERRIKDSDLFELLRRIVASYEIMPGRGLPIGNLTSQHFANFYLAHLDHFIKEQLRIPGYLRYMDDMVLFAENGATLGRALDGVRTFVHGRLSLDLKPAILGAVKGGLPFLGFVVFRDAVRLSRRKKGLARRRASEAYHNLAVGEWSETAFADHVLPVFSHLRLAQSLRFRQQLVAKWDHGIGLEPRETGRQLEQFGEQRSRC